MVIIFITQQMQGNLGQLANRTNGFINCICWRYYINKDRFRCESTAGEYVLNNSQLGSAMDIVAGIIWAPFIYNANTSVTKTATINCGQDSTFAGATTAGGNQDGNGIGDFKYAVPSGYLALCTKNLPEPSITLPGEHFSQLAYDDGAGAKTGVGFQPDLVWFKSRGSNYDHKVVGCGSWRRKGTCAKRDSCRTTDSTGLTAFGADGFTVGADTNYSDTTGTGMFAWNWLGEMVLLVIQLEL